MFSQNKLKKIDFKWKNIFSTLALVVLTLYPIILLFFKIKQSVVNMPFADDWDLMFVLDHYYKHSLSINDFFAQHNEHKLFFPQMIFLAVAVLGKWQSFHFAMISFGLSLAIFGIFTSKILDLYKEVKCKVVLFALPAVSFFVFSLNAGHNWLWNTQICMYMNVLFALSGFALLSEKQFSRNKFLLAILFGIISTFSFANGVFYWFCALIPLCVLSKADKNRQKACLVWIAMTVLMCFLYLYGYKSPKGHHDLLLIFKDFKLYISYFAGYLSNPVATNYEQYFLFALLGLLNLSLGSWYLLKTRFVSVNSLIVFITVAAYTLFADFITAIGRCGLGASQALNERYITISSLFWVANAVVLFLLFCKLKSLVKTKNSDIQFAVNGFVFLLCFITFQHLFLKNHNGSFLLSAHYERTKEAEQMILNNQINNDIIGRIGYINDLNAVKSRLKILKEHNLSLYSENK